MNDEDKLMTMEEVCEYLHLKESSIHKHRQHGRLRGVKLGGRRLFRFSAVQEFVRNYDKDREEEKELVKA